MCVRTYIATYNVCMQSYVHYIRCILICADDECNLPHVTDCTELLTSHVYGHKSIANVESKKLPELVRRFIKDAYLCIYIDTEGTMYQ